VWAPHSEARSAGSCRARELASHRFVSGIVMPVIAIMCRGLSVVED